jgi:hypothetical protein
VLVRGGNPIENLYLLDGIEVPNPDNSRSLEGEKPLLLQTCCGDSV